MPIYVPPRGSLTACIRIVGEAPGEQEELEQKPFVGASGFELTRMLHEAGILETDCFVTNFLRYRPPNNKLEAFLTRKKSLGQANHWLYDRGLWLSQTAQEHLKELHAEITRINPHVIVPLGNAALWATCGAWKISDHRGYIHTGVLGHKTIPTYHPAYILRMWGWRQVAIHDLKRIAREAVTREIQPQNREFIIRPSYETVINWFQTMEQLLAAAPVKLAVDIETRKGQIACIGLASTANSAICIPLHCTERPSGYWTLEEEVEIVTRLRAILTHSNLKAITQNFTYDNQYIGSQWGFIVNPWLDTMITQHVLFPGLPAG